VFSFSRRRSYSEKVLLARKRRKIAGKVLLALLVIAFIRAFFVQSYRVNDDSMAPSLLAGDQVFASPLLCGPEFLGFKLPALSQPYRGEMVLVSRGSDPFESGWATFGGAVLRFLSFQRFASAGQAADGVPSGRCIARVIATPGDRVRRERTGGPGFSVQPAGQKAYLPESATSRSHYSITGRGAAGVGAAEARTGQANTGGAHAGVAGRLDSLWPADNEMLLGPGEYFLAFDNRDIASGSLVWGPVPEDRILGSVFLIYWPFSRIRTK